MTEPSTPPPPPAPESPTHEQASAQPPTLLLVDGHSLAFRAYYAFANSRDGGLRTKNGIPTSVCFGFLKSLLEVMTSEQPKAVALAFDLGGPTFRHEADSNYKANRAETPEDFIPDVDNLTEILRAMDLPIFVTPGYEADDLLGTLAQKGVEAGYRVKILSGDRDLFQLVDRDRGISVLYMSTKFGAGARGSSTEEYDPDAVVDKMGVPPHQIVDFKALCGDTSDNIPGVKGIGPKTAVELLSQYPTLEAIYENLEAIKPAVRKKLESDRDNAFRSQDLARIVTTVPLNDEQITHIDQWELTGFVPEKVTPLLDQLELQSFLRQLQKLQDLFGGQPFTLASATIPSKTAPTKPQQPPSPKIPTSTPASQDPEVDFFSPEETAQSQSPSQSPSQSQAQAQAQAQLSGSPALQPQVIDTPEKLAALVEQLLGYTDHAIAWDTETTALDPREAELVGIGCCWGAGLGDLAYIPLGHRTLGSVNLELGPTLMALKAVLESDRHPKVLQNAKFDRLILKHQGVELRGVVFDTMLASYVLNPDASHKLEAIALRHLGFASESYGDLVSKKETIADIDVARVALYCGLDVYTTYLLKSKLEAALQQTGDETLALLCNVEQPLEPILAEMEDTGIRIDTAYLKTFSQQLDQDLKSIETNAYEIAGETFNLASPKQLGELLFDRLKLNTKKTRKTKTGAYSTDAAILEKLQGDHPIIDCILEHRTLAKLKSTYVDALPNLVRRETGRVHTDYNQAVTSTGRLSSSNPNLQNIPIRTAFSRQIRKAFIPQEGWLLVAADYSQIELRILTHLSQEPILLEAYQTGEDVHALTAKLLFEKETVTADERRVGKTINFGVIYGMGAQRFAREMGVSTKEASVFLERYHARYARVFDYLQLTERRAVTQGYVETLLGRRRYFRFESDALRKFQGRDPMNPDFIQDYAHLKSPGGYDAGLLRAAANAPIQGSSADIIKVAMVKLAELLRPYQARLLLQVHDELVFELPPEEWEELGPLIKGTMESAILRSLAKPIALSVPLVVEMSAGPNWMEAKG